MALDVDHHRFEEIIEHVKLDTGKNEDTELTASEWHRVVDGYKEMVAEVIGKRTRFRSLEIALDGSTQSYSKRVGSASNPSEGNPVKFYQRIFGPEFKDPNAAEFTPDAHTMARRSVLTYVKDERQSIMKDLGAADRARLADYLEDVREIERRIQQVEAANSKGEPRELPGAPIGVPDDFAEHAKLMFDLQAVAFASDTTRVFAFKMGRDASNRVYADSGFKGAFHSASHHQDRDDRITDFAKINKYHISMIPYFLNKLKNTKDGDATLLDNTLLIYGSPMGNSNVHNHKRCPLFFAGHAGGALKGNMHIKAADGTPMANAMLGALRSVGLDLNTFGDSNAIMDLNKASEATVA